MTDFLALSEAVAAALEEGRPLVALETTVIAQGLPSPRNLEAAGLMAEAVLAAGALPAFVGVIDGRLKVGLSDAELARFAEEENVAKLSARDLGPALAGGGLGATTVAATLAAAETAGIRVFATGGIGGVHRGATQSFDISADLGEMSRRAVAVVASGAKSLLDLPATLEVLESYGIPVIGYRTNDFPAFYQRDSGLALPYRLENPAELAEALRRHWGLGLKSAVLVANPIPEKDALARAEVEAWIDQALQEARGAAVTGQAVTPFVLSRLAELSAGRSLDANIALLQSNARLAGEIACALQTRD